MGVVTRRGKDVGAAAVQPTGQQELPAEAARGREGERVAVPLVLLYCELVSAPH